MARPPSQTTMTSTSTTPVFLRLDARMPSLESQVRRRHLPVHKARLADSRRRRSGERVRQEPAQGPPGSQHLPRVLSRGPCRYASSPSTSRAHRQLIARDDPPAAVVTGGSLASSRGQSFGASQLMYTCSTRKRWYRTRGANRSCSRDREQPIRYRLVVLTSCTVGRWPLLSQRREPRSTASTWPTSRASPSTLPSRTPRRSGPRSSTSRPT